MALYGKNSPHVSSSFLEGNNSVHPSPSLLSFHSNPFDVLEGRESTSRRSRKASFHSVPSFVSSDEVEESSEEALITRKPRSIIISFMVVYTMIFFNGCCFTAVMPSVPFYLHFLHAPPEFLGWVVSFYSLGQIFGSPTGGWLLSKGLSTKDLLTMTSTVGLVSSILYAVAPGYIDILFSRLLTGISAGAEFTTELTFIAEHTTFRERTAFLASVTACNVVGFIMGPALGNILAYLDIEFMGFTINQFTGPGWLLAFMFVLDIGMVRILFTDHALESDGKSVETDSSSEEAGLVEHEQQDMSYGGVDNNDVKKKGNDVEYGDIVEEADEPPPPSISVVLCLIFVQFSLMCGWSLVETVTSPIVKDYFEWDVREANFLFTCGGFVSLAMYVAFVVASKWVQDRWLVITALVLCTAGFLLGVDWLRLDWVPIWVQAPIPSYLPRFLAGFALLNAGFMTGRSVCFALYSKLIAQKYQSQYLGWMVAAGSVARTLGPFAAVRVYYGISKPGNELLALFGSVGIFHIVCFVLVCCLWSRLLPGSS